VILHRHLYGLARVGYVAAGQGRLPCEAGAGQSRRGRASRRPPTGPCLAAPLSGDQPRRAAPAACARGARAWILKTNTQHLNSKPRLERLVAEGVGAQRGGVPGNSARAVVQARVRAPAQQAQQCRVAHRAAQRGVIALLLQAPRATQRACRAAAPVLLCAMHARLCRAAQSRPPARAAQQRGAR